MSTKFIALACDQPGLSCMIIQRVYKTLRVVGGLVEPLGFEHNKPAGLLDMSNKNVRFFRLSYSSCRCYMLSFTQMGGRLSFTFGKEYMHARSTIAYEYRLSLEVGVISRDEIVRWADSLIENDEYDDRVAEVCIASNKSDKELEVILASIAGDEGSWDGVRGMLGRMYVALQRDPNRLPEFTRFLELLWIRSDYDVPEDLDFFVGIEDDYQLARDGIWPSVGRVRKGLLENLAKYAK